MSNIIINKTVVATVHDDTTLGQLHALQHLILADMDKLGIVGTADIVDTPLDVSDIEILDEEVGHDGETPMVNV